MFDLFVQAAWKVALAGILLGAGLPAVFALGVRLSAAGAGALETGGTATAQVSGGARTGYRAAAIVCFAVVAVAVAVGILIVIAAGFGKMVSFEHVFPTLVPKA